MEKKFIFIANWKAKMPFGDAIKFATENFDNLVALSKKTNQKIVLSPSCESLYPLIQIYKETSISIGAQNCSSHIFGSFTGAVTPHDGVLQNELCISLVLQSPARGRREVSGHRALCDRRGRPGLGAAEQAPARLCAPVPVDNVLFERHRAPAGQSPTRAGSRVSPYGGSEEGDLTATAKVYSPTRPITHIPDYPLS